MDIDATLREIRRLAEAVQSDGTSPWDEAVELADAFQALDDWLTGGGFLPRDWMRD